MPEVGVTHHQSDLEDHLREHDPSFKAHTDSCAEPRPSHLHQSPSVSGSLQVVASPCWAMVLPGVISANLSSDAWPLTPAVRMVHALVSSHPASAFSISSVDRHLARAPAKRLHAGVCFRGCRHFVMFRPPSLLATPVVPTVGYSIYPRPPWLLRPRISRFVTSPSSGYAHRPNRAIDGRGTCTLQDLRPCQPLRRVEVRRARP